MANFQVWPVEKLRVRHIFSYELRGVTEDMISMLAVARGAVTISAQLTPSTFILHQCVFVLQDFIIFSGATPNGGDHDSLLIQAVQVRHSSHGLLHIIESHAAVAELLLNGVPR